LPSLIGFVAKIGLDTKSPHLVVDLGSHSEYLGHEVQLRLSISFRYSDDLSLSQHVHHLIALDGSPGGVEGLEPQSWFNQPLEELMVLLNHVVQVLVLSQLGS
jgi:hypothetical protein